MPWTVAKISPGPGEYPIECEAQTDLWMIMINLIFPFNRFVPIFHVPEEKCNKLLKDVEIHLQEYTAL
jgi:hypothetical protein